MNYSIQEEEEEKEKEEIMIELTRRSSLAQRPRSFKVSVESVFSDLLAKNSLLNIDFSNKCFSITDLSFCHLSSFEGKCHLVSVSGAPLSGKSTILNLILSILSHQIEGMAEKPVLYTNVFKVGDGNRRTTDGIDYFCLKIGEDYIIFFDLEGDNNPLRRSTGEWIYSNLVSTGMAVSHVHLYNFTGFPGEHFLKYFDSISQIIKQNHLHDSFKPYVYMIKKDHECLDKEELIRDTKEIEAILNDRLQESGLEYSLHLLNKPPEHLMSRRYESSCLKLNGSLCNECRKHLYVNDVSEIALDILKRLKFMPPYTNGQKLLESIEKILEVNKRDLPYTVDMGIIEKIRLAKFHKEKERIYTKLNEVNASSLVKDVSKKIEKLLSDQEEIGNMESDMVDNFKKTLESLLTKVPQLDYLLIELSKFLEDSLLERTFTVLGNNEKSELLKIYIEPFKKTLNGALKDFREYRKIIKDAGKQIEPIKEEIFKHLKDYKKALFNYKSSSTVLTLQSLSSAALIIIAKEAALKFMGLGIAGIGVCLGIVGVVLFVRATKKFTTVKSRNERLMSSIAGSEVLKDDKEQVEKVVEYLEQVLNSIQSNNELMERILIEEERESDQEKLVKKVEEMLDMKIRTENYQEKDKEEVLKLFEDVKKKVETLKTCL